MIRCFTVKPYSLACADSLGSDLNHRLNQIERDGWKVLRVDIIPCSIWDHQKYRDTVCYIIIAEINDQYFEMLTREREREAEKSEGVVLYGGEK